MVMHARKVPRLNDGYYEKKASHHAYEESLNRYSSKSAGTNYANDCSRSRSRKSSPSNGSRSSRSRSPSADSRNRSPRYYHKLSYSQRIKDRDRGRDRDRDRDRERDKDRDRDRERLREREKERDRERDRDRLRDREKRDRNRDTRDRFHERREPSRSDHQAFSSSYSTEKLSNNTTNDRTNHGMLSREKSKTDEKRMRVGDWSEYPSSSGKRYYYNCRTGVSQWIKPREWIEHEKEQSKKDDKMATARPEKTTVPLNAKPSVITEEPKTNCDADSSCNNNSTNTAVTTTATTTTIITTNTTINNVVAVKPLEQVTNRDPRDPRRLSYSGVSSVSVEKRTRSADAKEEFSNASTEFEISPGVRSERRNSVNYNSKDNILNDKSNSAIGTPRNYGVSATQPMGTNQGTVSPSQITVNNLPKLISQLTNTHGLPDLSELSPEEALKTITQALQLTKQAKQRSTNQTVTVQRQQNLNSPLVSTPLQNQTARESPSSTSTHVRHHNQRHHPHNHPKHNHHHSQHHHQHSQHHQSHAYHHQSADGIRHELDLLINRSNWGQSPNSDVSVNSSNRSPTSSVTSITPGIGSSLRSCLPSLTPSLANYFREDLIQHVVAWQADHAERQAQKYAEEAHNIGSLNVTRVSAELKMSRSLVRLAEIQATLQEQRILFVTQQIKDVEEWKSQNASHFASHS